MRTVIDTVYFQSMMVTNIRGNTYTPITGTTINDYLNIPITKTDGTPKISHYTMGIMKKGDNALIDSYEHSPIDILPYKMIPLYMLDKSVSEELPEAIKTEYSLIKELKVGDKTYIACYAKSLDNKENSTSLYNVEFSTATEKYNISLFKFTDAQLGEPKPKVGKDYVFANTQPSIAVSSPVSVVLSLQEVGYIKDVLNILYPNSTEYDTSSIFEIGIVASNGDDGYFQHTHYKKVNKFLSGLTLDSNSITEIDIGAMSPINL